MDHYFSGGGGGGMRNIEKNCLQGLKRQNKLFANGKKIVCTKMMLKKKMFAETYMFKKMFAEENFSYPPSRKMVRLLARPPEINRL